MLAYAANSRPAQRDGSPKLLTLVILGHLAAVGVLLTTKMVIEARTVDKPPIVVNIKEPPPPPPNPIDPIEKHDPIDRPIFQPPITVPIPQPTPEPPLPFPLPQGDPVSAGSGSGGGLTIADPPKPTPVRVAARINTPESLLRPPYPLSKIRAEEEATLRLKLSIDERGRVVAVDPVGAADPDFLAAARRHLIRAWRYKPATVDGVAAPSTIVITLSFRLENA